MGEHRALSCHSRMCPTSRRIGRCSDAGIFTHRFGRRSASERSMRDLAAFAPVSVLDIWLRRYGRGEGFAVAVLALASDDHARPSAVVLGTAVNQDGRSSGLTAPNGPAQTRLLAEVAAEERLGPSAMALVAIHGTGTPLGDPIEVNALGAALAGGRGTSRSRIAVGAVKSCYGHTEGTAGLSGAWFCMCLWWSAAL